MLLPRSFQYPNLSETVDSVSGQTLGNKECPFSGVTSSGRAWRKVPESDARSGVRSGVRRWLCGRGGDVSTVRGEAGDRLLAGPEMLARWWRDGNNQVLARPSGK